jgi:hypothetical protein
MSARDGPPATVTHSVHADVAVAQGAAEAVRARRTLASNVKEHSDQIHFEPVMFKLLSKPQWWRPHR